MTPAQHAQRIALPLPRVLTFAGYTTDEIREVLSWGMAEALVLALEEAADLGCRVLLCLAEARALSGPANAIRALIARVVLWAGDVTCRPSRRRAAVDAKGYRNGLAKPRGWGVCPSAVVQAQRVGAAREASARRS